jgi:gliding motility-associated-like protein
MVVTDVKCLIENLNVFTPNNDGVNETFDIADPQSKPIYYSLTIFNRWGQKVFETKQHTPSWDGNQLPDGTYFYQLEAEFCQGNPIKKSGFVKLVK